MIATSRNSESRGLGGSVTPSTHGWMSCHSSHRDLQKDPAESINEHLKNLYAEEELTAEATIRKFRSVRIEGTRNNSVVRNSQITAGDGKFYNLPADA